MTLSVLILADDCNPEWASLPIVAHNTIRELQRSGNVNITVATHVRNRENIEVRGELKNVVYIDTEAFAGPVHKISKFFRGGDQVGWTTGVAFNYPMYLAFEAKVKEVFGADIMSDKFDIVHRLTPMSPSTPSLLAKFCRDNDVAFVVGPVNGGLPWPKQFQQESRKEKEWLLKLRNFHKHLPFYTSTYENADAVLAAFDHTKKDIPTTDNVVDFPEIGFDPELFYPSESVSKVDNRKVNFLFAGRLVPYKLPTLALECFARSALLREHATLTIVGDGPEKPEMDQLARSMPDCVRMLGKQSQSEVANEMRASDIFIFPSIRELGAGVIVEAMACGSIPLIVSYGAPSDLVSNDSGFKMPMGTREELINDFVEVMEYIIKHKSKIVPFKRKNALSEVQEFSWANKAKKILRIYDDVIAKKYSVAS